MKAMIFPGKYFQGERALEELPGIVTSLGAKKPMLIWDTNSKKAVVGVVGPALESAGMGFVEYMFPGECTKEVARAIAQACRDEGCDIVVGLGGGKVMDAAKAVAIYTEMKVIIAPTVASNDAPTSACTVWYDDNHVMTGFDLWPVSPNVILADTGGLVNAPPRMLKAGVGDALATHLEALASYKTRKPTCAGGTPTDTVMALTKLCLETLMANAEDALIAVEAGAVTPRFESFVEAVVLLSGLGWESGGLATAHTLGNGLPSLEETHGALHGEKVALGIVTQLMLDPDIDAEEAKRIVTFMAKIGLPVCFEDLNMQNISKERLYTWCEENTAEGSFCHNHAFPVTARSLYNAMLMANQYGISIKRSLNA